MAHDRPKQSKGAWKGNKDRHQKTNPKGPRPAKNQGVGKSYVPPKYR